MSSLFQLLLESSYTIIHPLQINFIFSVPPNYHLVLNIHAPTKLGRTSGRQLFYKGDNRLFFPFVACSMVAC